MPPCPDCGSTADRGGATREAAMETPMAACPNQRHASWRLVWGIAEPEHADG